MAATRSRPLSPHLTVWRWGPHMLVSILHRITGGALTFAGLGVLVWWLTAISGTPTDYERFASTAKHPLALVVLIGLTWAFFQHTLSGLRHLVMDTGAGLELQTSKRFSIATLGGSLILTLLVWAFFLGAFA